MARYDPTAEMKIAKPCGESWEAMRGDSRVRHCDACGCDVINAASLTPEQIEEHIEAALDGKPMPCMRLVQFEDGSLLTAQTGRRLSFVQRAVAGVSAFAVIAASAIAQSSAAATATLRGRVVDPHGAGVSSATVRLHQPNHPDVTVKTGDDGAFAAEAAPGNYAIDAEKPGFTYFATERVVLHTGVQELARPLKLETGMWLGRVVVSEKPLKTTTPRAADVTQ